MLRWFLEKTHVRPCGMTGNSTKPPPATLPPPNAMNEKPNTYGSPEFRQAAEKREGFKEQVVRPQEELEREVSRYFEQMKEAEEKAFTKSFAVG